MRVVALIGPAIVCGVALIASGVLIWLAHLPAGSSPSTSGVGLPAQVDGWRAAGDDQVYDNRSIFHYIDGGAEVYRAYNMRTCLSRRYLHPGGPAIVLDLFDMGTAADAFGVFTHDTTGEPLDIGQGAYFRAGWLSFWKGPWFVSITAEDDTAPAVRAVKDLGRTLAGLLPGEGEAPAILKSLPPDGLDVRDIRYLHDHLMLNIHHYLADENLLRLSARTEAALAGYSRDGQSARLLLVRYPGDDESRRALESFRASPFLGGSPDGKARAAGGSWTAARRFGPWLAVVLEAESETLAESLLEETGPRLSR